MLATHYLMSIGEFITPRGMVTVSNRWISAGDTTPVIHATSRDLIAVRSKKLRVYHGQLIGNVRQQCSKKPTVYPTLSDHVFFRSHVDSDLAQGLKLWIVLCPNPLLFGFQSARTSQICQRDYQNLTV